jgi:hypothetical protein
MAIWGPSFLLRPLSLLFIAMIVGSIVFYVVRLRGREQRALAYDA